MRLCSAVRFNSCTDLAGGRRLPEQAAGAQVAVRFVRDANTNLQAFDMWQAAFVNYPDTPWRRSAVAYMQARCLALTVQS